MGNFNELSINDIYEMHEAVGMEFVIEDGEIQGAYIPAERIR